MSLPDTQPDSERKPRQVWAEVNPFPSIFQIAPANRDHEVAIRCAITVLVPLLVLFATDRMDLVVFASFGAFPSIYGRNLEHGPRMKMQLRAGALMFCTLMASTIMARLIDGVPGAAWIAVICTAVMAGITALVAQYWQLRPGGSLFNVFAFGAVTAVPHHPVLWQAALTTLIAIVWALLIGVSSRVLSKQYRRPFQWPQESVFAGSPHRQFRSDASLHVLAAGAAGCVALLLSDPWNIQHTYWAQLAAVVPLAGHTTKHAVNRGIHRIVGTFLGLFGTALILWLHPPVLVLILIVAVMQGLTELFILRSYVLGQLFVTPLALLSVVLATVGSGGAVESGELVYDRFIQTVIGAFVGIVVVLIPWALRHAREKYGGRRIPALR